MILSIKISDETYEKYGKLNSQNPRYAIEQVLDKYADVGYSNKSLVLFGEKLAELQKLIGPVDSPEALIEAVKKAISVTIGDVTIPLSESQRKNLVGNAKFFGQSPEAFAEAQIKRGLTSVLGV